MTEKEKPKEKFSVILKELEKHESKLDFLMGIINRPKPKLFSDNDMFFMQRAIEESIRHCDKNIEQYPKNNAYKKERDHCFVLKGKIEMLWALTERDKK